jgi:hypothetical protein
MGVALRPEDHSKLPSFPRHTLRPFDQRAPVSKREQNARSTPLIRVGSRDRVIFGCDERWMAATRQHESPRDVAQGTR